MRETALLTVLFLFCAHPARPAPVPFVMQGLGRATLPIDGPWQFHTGDNPAWASPGFDDSGWQQVRAGESWEQQGHRGYTGFAWYRRRLVLPAESPADWNLALLLPGVEDACEVYWNGAPVGSFGRVPPHPVWFGIIMMTSLNQAVGNASVTPIPSWFNFRSQGSFVLGPARSGELAIRVWKAPYVYFSFANEGGLTGAPILGSTEAIAGLEAAARYGWLRGILYQLIVALFAALISLLALLAWFRDRRQWMLFWLALYMIHPLALLPFASMPGLLSFRWSYGLIAPVICVEDVSLWFLLLYLLGLRDNRRLVRWTWCMTAIAFLGNFGDGSLQLFQWTTWPNHLFLALDVGITIPALLVEAWGAVLVLFAFRRRLDAARWTLAITALLADLIQAATNWFSLGVRWTHWTFYRILIAPLVSVGGNPFDPLTIANTLLLVAIAYAVWRYSIEQSQRQNALEQEYRSAQELQQVLVPDSLPSLDGYAVTSAYRPAQVVGGDFFQVIPLPAGSALVVIGDVSGKGLPAAMAVALIVGAIRSTAETTSDPALLLAALNRRLHGRLRGGFATCLALRLDPGGDCTIASAGHLPPFLDGKEAALPAALPLGMLLETEYTQAGLRIGPGSSLTLYTDGVVEARSAAGELFGFGRARAISTQPAEAIAQTAQAFGQEDDITVLTFTLLAPAAQPG